MTDEEYNQYITTVKQGLKTLRKYGNWAVPPWIIKKYGFANAQQDLCMRAGKQYHLRKSIYMNEEGKRDKKNVYYILELANKRTQ